MRADNALFHVEDELLRTEIVEEDMHDHRVVEEIEVAQVVVAHEAVVRCQPSIHHNLLIHIQSTW